MSQRLIPHGLLQWAALQAERTGYRVKPSRHGVTVERRVPTGWKWVADFADRDDAEAFVFGGLTQIEPTDAPR